MICLCCGLLLGVPLLTGKAGRGDTRDEVTAVVPEKKKETGARGIASYYADKFNGQLTANGEVFSNSEMTAAHNTLPLGTYVKVTNLRNGRSVIVRITDRLHRENTRIIDLTKAAARKLGFLTRGLTRVRVEEV